MAKTNVQTAHEKRALALHRAMAIKHKHHAAMAMLAVKAAKRDSDQSLFGGIDMATIN